MMWKIVKAPKLMWYKIRKSTNSQISLIIYIYIYIQGKLQITPLKFGGDWILHLEISKFGFHPITFEGIWSLHPKVS